MATKNKKIASLAVLSLITLLTISAFSAVQADEQEIAKNFPPGIPENAVQYNRTDVTPNGYIETVQAMNMNVYTYRNVTMLMNCTKNCEMNVTIDPQVQNRIVGVDVDPNQTMTLAMNMTANPPQGVATMERTLNFYMGIEPNATLQLQAQLKLHINQTELNSELGREVNASKLSWMYWNQTQNQWVQVESYMNQEGYLVCNTDHFSTWTVAELASPTTVPENINILTVVALAATITVAIALLTYRKLKTKEK